MSRIRLVAPATVLALVGAALPLATAQVMPSGEPFFDNAKAGAQLRSLYFRRDLPASVQESWALGGWVWGQTGYWRDLLQLGGTVYASAPLYAPEDRDGTLSLKPGQDGYAVIGEAFARLKGGDHALTLYRQRIGRNPQKAEGVRSLQTDLNYLGSRDIRMTPTTYEALMANGRFGDSLLYQAGYVDRVKDVNSDQFVSMSRLAGVTTKDAGLWNAGAQWSPLQDLWLQGFYYWVEDTLSIAYGDVDWVNRLSKDSYYRLAAQFSDQRSTGNNLLIGRDFRTWQAAIYGEYGWQWLTLYGAFGSTGDGQQMRTPYSFGPFYISQRIKTFNRAGEDAALLGSTFNLAGLGFTGFSVDVNFSDGRHAIDANTGAALPRWREFDTDFVYRFARDSAVPGMRLRLRWATVREDFGTRVDRTDDFRLDLNWSVAFN